MVGSFPLFFGHTVQHVESCYPTRNRNCIPCIGSMESLLLDHQGSSQTYQGLNPSPNICEMRVLGLVTSLSLQSFLRQPLLSASQCPGAIGGTYYPVSPYFLVFTD